MFLDRFCRLQGKANVAISGDNTSEAYGYSSSLTGYTPIQCSN
jgi:hypothetical protein